MRSRAVILIGAAVLLGASVVEATAGTGARGPSWQAAAAPVAHPARRAKRCRSLRGRDLAPARRVRLVRRRNSDDGTDLLGCILPRGRIRKLASSADLYTTVYDYDLRQVAGAIVLIEDTYNSQYGESRGLSVHDVRSGRSYGIAAHCSMIGGSLCRTDDTAATAAFVNRSGQAAAAIVPAFSGTTFIAGFSARGRRQDLDSGPSADLPAAALRLSGSTVSWTHSGLARSAVLAP